MTNEQRYTLAFVNDQDREGNGPQDDDYIVTCNGNRSTCNLIDLPRGAGDDDYATAIHAQMEEDQYWPNVWFVSDHGNLDLCILEPVAP